MSGTYFKAGIFTKGFCTRQAVRKVTKNSFRLLLARTPSNGLIPTYKSNRTPSNGLIPTYKSKRTPSNGLISSQRFQSTTTIGTGTRKNFDTRVYIDMMKAEGFTENEAIGLINIIIEMVDESTDATRKMHLSTLDQEKHMEKSVQELARIKTDVVNLEKKDFAALKVYLDQVKMDVDATKATMANDMSRIHSGVSLDCNLEKSRIEEETHALFEQLKQAEGKIAKQMEKLDEKMNSIRQGTKTATTRLIVSIVGLMIGFRIILSFS